MASEPLELKFDGKSRYSWQQFGQLFGMQGFDPDNTGGEFKWYLDRETIKPPPAPAESRDNNDRVSVFARVRPLLAAESEKGIGILSGIAQRSSSEDSSQALALRTSGGLKIGGFAGVLGPEASNADVFSRALAPRLDTVLRGGATCAFCYGYTGGGKTHTSLGYGGEAGLFELAAQDLLQRLPEGKGMFLNATAIEVYGDAVSDLLGPTKTKCQCKKDELGELQIRGPATTVALEGLPEPPPPAEGTTYPAWVKFHDTTCTQAVPLRGAAVRTPEDVRAVTDSSVKMRAVGSSTEHAQSSRSHCVVQMEVVTEAYVAAREDVVAKRAVVAPLRNAVENTIFHFIAQLLDLSDPDALSNGGFPLRLYGDEGGGGDGADSAARNEWARRKASLSSIRAGLLDKVEKAMREVIAAEEKLRGIERTNPTLGGTLSLVDLAGADYDHREVKQKKDAKEKMESVAINKSLLALKNCLRAIAKVPGAPSRPPFRESQLTRILESVLLQHPRRGARESVGVMLLAVSPAEHIERMTINALRYGQMFSGEGKAAVVAGGRTRGGGGGETIKPWSKMRRAAANTECAPALLEELRAIYRQHAPEKSSEDVDAILSKFKGREAVLLTKVRAKYVDGGV